MSAPVIAPVELTILDVESDQDRLAHFPCGIHMHRPDEPMHALCGHPLLGVDAPPDAERCSDCVNRVDNGGGGFAALLGVLRCDQHPAGAR